MDTNYLTGTDWAALEAQHPRAFAFLLNAALTNEQAHLDGLGAARRTAWQESRWLALSAHRIPTTVPMASLPPWAQASVMGS